MNVLSSHMRLRQRNRTASYLASWLNTKACLRRESGRQKRESDHLREGFVPSLTSIEARRSLR
jgi:hypothetical protein